MLGLTTALFAGCAPKEITALQRKQGASLVSEASFAMTLRDYPRAEGLLVQAVAACPDNSDYWLSLGTVRRRMDNRAGARESLEQALQTGRARYKREPQNSQLLLQQVYVLALLGRVDEARATLAQARKDHPDDRNIRVFAENGELDRILADPGFRELAL
jgi:tetratricopeptide (TPR) repeat protein